MAFRDRAVAAAYIAGWKLVGKLPPRLTAKLFDAAADRVSLQGAGMDQLRRNLTRVVGAENVTRKLVRDSMRSYARYWREAFQLPRLAGDPELMRRLDPAVKGLEHLDAGLAKGKGVVLVLPHSGNWDMAGMWLVQRYGQFTTVAERLKPEALFDAFVDFRQSLGFEVLALTGEKTPPYARLRETLEAGGIVCLLGERDFSGRGVPVTFFDEGTTFPAGPAKLAVETGSELLVVHSWFTGDAAGPGWGLQVSPPLEVTTVAETTQRIADGFEANIAAHPEDWHMLQPLWPADRELRRRLDPRRREG
ncbi:phosphatidylinositol mannoside acyltransferase [Corynebacterium sp. BCW_4722]|nr:phosphatidylinositol mannoside acyltransferase [Corynebacterium sp. BCW_4722]